MPLQLKPAVPAVQRRLLGRPSLALGRLFLLAGPRSLDGVRDDLGVPLGADRGGGGGGQGARVRQEESHQALRQADVADQSLRRRVPFRFDLQQEKPRQGRRLREGARVENRGHVGLVE